MLLRVVLGGRNGEGDCRGDVEDAAGGFDGTIVRMVAI